VRLEALVSYVNLDDAGWTELRVHGVSGTPPESMLRHPNAHLVAGNSLAGFYRRAWEAESTAEDTRNSRLEAYSWGGLTSGDNRRALWLLLLPFMLLNVAYYMTPSRRLPDSDHGKRTDRFSASVQRLLALSFTVMFALTVVTVAMDLVGWQCGAGAAGEGRATCAGGGGWLGWLGWSWLSSPGRQLVVTALVPLAAFLLLWRLAQNTWRSMESAEVPQSVGEPTPLTPLEDRAMWNGREAVRRLRALHVSAGLAVPGVFVAAALLPDPSKGLGAVLDSAAWDTPATVIRSLALLALLALLLGVAVTVAWPGIASRERPLHGPEEKQQAAQRTKEAGERRSPFRFLPWVALALTALAGAAAWPYRGAARVSATGLPWLVSSVLGLFVVQAVLVVFLFLVCARLRRLAPARGQGGPEGVEHRPAWRGFGMPLVAVLGWLLAGGLSAGVALRAADSLGQPVAEGHRTEAEPGDVAELVVPTAYHWVAVVGLAAGVIALGLAGFAYYRLRKPSPEDLERVDLAYRGQDPADHPERRKEIAGQWRKARGLADLGRQLFGSFLAALIGLVLAGTILYLTVGTRLLTGAPLLVTVAGLALTASVLAVLWVGRQAYRNPAFRRTIGIAWDLGTFWPRAVHPLAPPCYAERAIPDLLGRLQLFADSSDGRRALLSCHSQGAVLGAAALLQAEESVTANTCFLTYGAPLARLYQRFFPAYFSRPTLQRLGGFLACHPPVADEKPRAGWRWRNLYRHSDPIGGAVFTEYPATLELDPNGQATGDNQDVDRQLIDPAFAREAGNPCYPPTHGHSDYFADPAFDWTVDALRDRHLPACASRTADPVRSGLDQSSVTAALAPSAAVTTEPSGPE
jgi:hypothetical protein